MTGQELMGKARHTATAAVFGFTILAAFPVLVHAQATPPATPPANNSAAAGSAWSAKVAPTGDGSVTGIVLEAAQLKAIASINTYFNGLKDMQGEFTQTTSDKKRLRGKFYMKRPGRVRFEYSPPSRQLIISDGKQIAIQDLDIQTDDRITVDQTPFKVLLRDDVDLVRDAHILEVQESDDLLIVALRDKSKDSSGSVRLFMTKTPAVELREWVTTDVQGLDTRLEVTKLDKTTAIDADLFKIKSPGSGFGKIDQ